MRNYVNANMFRNSQANSKSKNKATRYIGNTGKGVYRNPHKALAAVAAIENIVRAVDTGKFNFGPNLGVAGRKSKYPRPRYVVLDDYDEGPFGPVKVSRKRRVGTFRKAVREASGKRRRRDD